MGVQILGTSTIVENSGRRRPDHVRRRCRGQVDGSAPPVKIGPVTVSAQVTVTYIYEP